MSKKPESPVGEEDYDANRNAVEALCRESPNNVCNDCGSIGTRWASVNHGIFVCIRCSGHHRNMGTHVSKVKSTNMDKWTAAEVKLMSVIGNKRGKEYYESKLPKGTKPLDGTEPESVIKDFLKKKYEDKAYSCEDINGVMKKAYKKAGYKGYKLAKSTVEEPKKSKKAKIEGVFGAVSLNTEEEHDAKRAALFAHFGVAESTAAEEQPQAEAPAEEAKADA
jgi:hypothetical protein